MEHFERHISQLVGTAATTSMLISVQDDADVCHRAWYLQEHSFALHLCRLLAIDTDVDTGALVCQSVGGIPLTCCDVAEQAREARAQRRVLVVDNTFPTAAGCAAIRLGAHVVVESLAHACGSVGAGVVAVSLSPDAEALLPGITKRLEERSVPDGSLRTALREAYTSFEALRRKQNDAAQVVATYLVCHPRIVHVWYPGLLKDQEDSSQRDIRNVMAPRTLFGGFGSVVDFAVRGDHPLGDRAADDAGSVVAVAIAHGQTIYRWHCADEDPKEQVSYLESLLAAPELCPHGDEACGHRT